MKIEKAKNTDSKIITELTIRSKNYWNYGAEQIEEWGDQLTISPKYITENKVYKLVNKEKLIGFYAYKLENLKDIKLDFLFIEPKFIGQGFGKILITDFLKRIEKTAFKRIILDADPNAEKFYKKNGFKVIRKLQSSIKNRTLPIMEFKLR